MKHNLYFFNDRVLLHGKLIGHPVHRHYLMQIVVSKEIFSKKYKIDVYDSNYPHSMINLKGHYLSFLIDPLSALGRKLKPILLDNGGRLTIKYDKDKFKKIFNNNSGDDLYSLSDKIINYLTGESPRELKLDSRIRKALKLINISDKKNIHADEIYREAGLSESHFHLLFKKEVGLTFRKYILWKKLKKATVSILNGNDFTTAAHNGGFSDSAHLSRTFKENTGVSLSVLFKNKRFIQVHNKLTG